MKRKQMKWLAILLIVTIVTAQVPISLVKAEENMTFVSGMERDGPFYEKLESTSIQETAVDMDKTSEDSEERIVETAEETDITDGTNTETAKETDIADGINTETAKETDITDGTNTETAKETDIADGINTETVEETDTFSETITVSVEEPTTDLSETTDVSNETKTVTESSEIEETTSQQESTFASAEDNASDRTITKGEESDIQYILGREMTPEEINAQKAMEPEYLPELEIVELPTEAAVYADSPLRQKMRTVLPAQYDLRTSDKLPAVRNQNPWGACWTFAFLGLMEYSLVDQGFAQPEHVNLSEHHLAYFTYHTGYDALDNANDDTIESDPQNYYLQTGGNDYRAALRLMNWQGAAEEEQYPYPNDTNLPNGYSRDSAQDYSAFLKTCSFYPTKANDAETRQIVKNLILENGCASWSYFNDSKFHNYSTAAYFNSERTGTNHAIIVVGWDDDYARENFLSDNMPENDGAWIVRNSWGSQWGEKGYFYISYEDISLGSGNAVCVAQADCSGKYDNNYFHSNSIGMKQYGKYKKVAQIYQVKSPDAVKEKLAAISFMIGSAGVEYTIQVYKNPKLTEGVVKDPESGTPMLESPVTGTVPYAGVYTVELPNPVEFDADDNMAIVISFPENAAFMYCDSDYTASSSSEGSCNAKNMVEAGESLYMLSSTWQDMSASGRSLRINALTIDDKTIVKVPTLQVMETQEAAGFGDMPYVLLRWSKCSAVQGYEVYRSFDGQNYEKIASVGADTRQYRDTLPAREETKCYYQVKALYNNSTGESSDTVEESNIVNTQFTGVIQGAELAITYNGKIADFSWKAVEGADLYELQHMEDASGTYETVLIFQGEQTTYSFDVTEYAMGIYSYRIRAGKESDNGTMYSQWSEADLAKDFVVESSGYQTATLSWLPIADADEYKVRILVGTTWYIYSVKTSPENEKTTYTFQFDKVSYEVKTGEPYQYRMMAYQAGKEIYTSSTIVHCLPPATPQIYVDTDNANQQGITLAWSGGDGATAVDIYRSESAQDKGEQIATMDITEGSYTDTTELAIKKMYFYYLTPYVENTMGEKIYGLSSDRVTVYQPPAVPKLSSVIEQDGAVVIQWSVVSSADGYVLEKSENGDIFTQIADLQKEIVQEKESSKNVTYQAENGELENDDICQYIDKNVSRCNQYRYRVTAYYFNDAGESIQGSTSEIGTIRLLPEAAEIEKIEELDAGRTGMRIAVYLPQIENAQYFQLYRSETGEDGSYRQIAKITDSSVYIDQDVAYETVYFYKVLVTIDAFTSALKDTNAVQIVTKPKYPEPITILSAAEPEGAAAGTQVVLTIPQVENAQYYLLYRSKNGENGAYVQIAKILADGNAKNAESEDGGDTADTVTYIDNTVEPDTEYYYKVLVAVNNVTSLLQETMAFSIRTKAKPSEEQPSDPDNPNPDDKEPEKPILPEPITIFSIKEVDSGKNSAQIVLTIAKVESAQYYYIYRSEDGEHGTYKQIAALPAMQELPLTDQNNKSLSEVEERSIEKINYKISDTAGNFITYTDKSIKPETEYFYKVLVMVQNQTTVLENTNASHIVTKPILQSFTMLLSDKDICQGSSQELAFLVEPIYYPYTPDELVWAAQDINGEALSIVASDGKMVVMGTDEKELLSIETITAKNDATKSAALESDSMENDFMKYNSMEYNSMECNSIAVCKIYAIGASEVKMVRLFATLNGRSAAVTICIYKNEGFQVTSVENQYYTGSAITPPIKVYDQGRLLTKGVDYSVSYKNNKNVNNASDITKAPSVIVTGKGNYTGKGILTFSILPIDISDTEKDLAWDVGKEIANTAATGTNINGRICPEADSYGMITVDNVICAYRKNKTQKPIPTVLWNGSPLKKGRDFTVEYPDTSAGAYRETGAYTVRIKGINNFTGTRDITLLITNEGLISKTTVSKIKAQTYTGGEIQPSITVKSGKRILIENQDYTVTYVNNVEVGTATAIITGTGLIGDNNITITDSASNQSNVSPSDTISYYGVKRVSFQIKGININKAVVSGLEKSVVYTGSPIKQTNYVLSMKTPQGTETLREGTDYITIQNSINAGTGYIIFQGINAYTGTLKKSFKITPYDLEADIMQQMHFMMDCNVPYTKGGSMPAVEVMFGYVLPQNEKELQSDTSKNPQIRQPIFLQNGVDYKLTYRNHTTISQRNTPSITITGKGNFKGKKTLEFTILKQDIDRLSITASDKVYTAKTGAYKTKVSVTDTNGKALKAGKDYESKILYTYARSVKLSDGTIRSEGEAVGDKDILPIGTLLNATVTGINNYQGSLIGQFRITEFDISKAKVTITPQTYTGAEIVPQIEDITVVYKGRTLEYGTEYILEDCADNIKKGKAVMIIQGIGDFGGQKKVKFVIRSKKVGG